jgi:hypothetical protein
MRRTLLLMLLACGLTLAAQARDDTLPPGEYRVAGSRVDRGTWLGWRVFHAACHACHGVGGVGTDLAPSLVERVKTMTPRDFAAKVLTSYRLVPLDVDDAAERERLLEEVMKRDRRTRGQVLMPAWDVHERVASHVLDLYAYLNARADGAVGPGPLQPLPQGVSPGRTR